MIVEQICDKTGGVNWRTQGVGTASYASPEQLSGMNYTSQSDMYSLGMILIELYAPFRTGHERVQAFSEARNHPPKVPLGIQKFSPKMAALIEKLIDHDPDERPSATSIVEVMDRAEKESECLHSFKGIIISQFAQIKSDLEAKNNRLEEQDVLIKELKKKLSYFEENAHPDNM